MSSRVTQCPKCQTSFRVTDAQLDIANGAVRCGSCLHIFNAPEHWIGDSTEAQPSPEPVSNPDDSFGDLMAEDDDFAIDDNFDTDQLFADDEDDPLISDSEPDTDDDDFLIQDTTQRPIIEPDDLSLPAEEETLRFEDTAAQDSLFEGMEDGLFDENTGDTLDLDGDLSDSFLDMDSWEESPTAVFKELDDITSDDDLNETDSWAEQLLADDEPEEDIVEEEPIDLHPDFLDSAPEAPAGPELDPDLVALLNEAPEHDYDIQSQTTAQPAISEQDINELEQLQAQADSFSAGDRIGHEAPNLSEPAQVQPKPLISGIEPEPVEMIKPKVERNYGSWLWRAAILVGVLALPWQYIQYNYETLARSDSYRPLFKTVCGFTGCKLPELHDVGLIRSSNLMVRSHPKAANALVVDAMMTNQAKFKQPFPMLELQFTDINGQIVAGRRFAPSDYVAGELLGMTMMPAKQPIHISLQIIDPGSAAVNYQLRFLPNP